MQITQNVIMSGTGCDAAHATLWLAPFVAAMAKFSINNPKRVAALLANVGVESGSLTRLSENLNYSAQGLADTWPQRFAVDPKQPAGKRVPNGLANQLQRDPVAIANSVYADRLGNGPAASGDGWRYRGAGPIQLTGKDNMLACGNATGLDLAGNPSQLQQPTGGAMSAAWFFASKGCNDLADADRLGDVIRVINGAGPCAANNGPLRASRYMNCLLLLQQR